MQPPQNHNLIQRSLTEHDEENIAAVTCSAPLQPSGATHRVQSRVLIEWGLMKITRKTFRSISVQS